MGWFYNDRWGLSSSSLVEPVVRAGPETESTRIAGRGDLLFQVLNSIGDPVMVIDREGFVLFANRAGHEFRGVRIGETHSDFHWADSWEVSYVDGAKVPAENMPCRRAFLGQQVVNEEYSFTAPGKAPVRMLVNLSIVRLHRHKPAGVLVLRDVTGYRALEQKRQDVIWAASHDLRTPLSVINAQAQLLRLKLMSNPVCADSEKGLGVILKAAHQMSRMLDDLLYCMHLAQDEASKTSTDLRELLQDLLEQVSVLQGKDRITFECQEDMPRVFLEKSKIERAVANLVGNAVKFSEGGPVNVKCWFKAGWFYVSVRDSGPGMAEEESARAFDRFYRSRSSGSRTGLGLGLHIAKTIVESHGGSIWVESEAGKGCNFTFRLPEDP